MTYEREADYTESFLLPPAVEDWVGQDHPARFVRSFVDSLDLGGLGFRVREASRGAPSYSSGVLLKAWLYGYLRRITSSRRLEEACRENMGLIWLLGRLEPDHNTLWRFWKHNREAIGGVFRQSVRVAAKLKLVGLVLHALDSTKIQASCSRRGSWLKKDLEAVAARIDKRLEELEGAVVRAEEREPGEYRLEGEVAELAGRRDAVAAALKELEEEETRQLQPKERQARLMKAGGRGALEFGYSNQAVMDEESRLIVACDTVNESSDVKQLNSMLDRVEETLGEVSRLTVADANYGQSEKELARAEEEGREVLVARPGQEREGFHVANFEVDVDKRTCVCPLGRSLRFCGYEREGKRARQLRFECPVAEGCPRREDCASQRRGKWVRRVKAGIHRGAADRQRCKQKEAKGGEALQRRQELIEPFFGWVKEDFGLRRFTFKGLKGAGAQWAMVCLTWNLKRMMKMAGDLGDKKRPVAPAQEGRMRIPCPLSRLRMA
jgi:transposase